MRQKQLPRTASASRKPAELDRRGGFSKRAVAIALLSLAGIGVAAYLTYGHYSGGSYFCAGLGNCDYVNSSPYAMVAGVPVALLGLLAYVGILAAVLVNARGSGELASTWAPLAIFGLALGGVLFSAYLSYVEVFILHAI